MNGQGHQLGESDPRPLLLVGPEPLRRHLVERGGRQHIDLNDDPNPANIPTSSLWGLRLRVTGVEKLNAKELPELKTILDAAVGETTHIDRPRTRQRKHDPSILLEADSFDRRNERHLPNVTIVRVETRNVGTVETIAGHLGVTVDPNTLSWLTAHHADDPGRIVGTLEALAAGGYRTPTRRQIELLAGNNTITTLPWHLLDDTLNGRPVGTSSLHADPIPSIAYINRRLTLAALIAEQPDITSETLEHLLGKITPQAEGQARSLSRRLGAATLRQLVGSLAQAEQHAKRSNGTAGLLILVATIRLLTRTPAEHVPHGSH